MFRVLNSLRRVSAIRVALLSWFLVSCVSPFNQLNDPKQNLTDYIAKSFSVSNLEDRKQLMNFLTGDVKSRLGGWSEDQFRAAFIDSKREFIKLAYREIKPVSATEVQITYELVYVDQGAGKDGKKHEAKITNRKLCQMTLEHGKWLISDVRNIKELVEYKNELSLP